MMLATMLTRAESIVTLCEDGLRRPSLATICTRLAAAGIDRNAAHALVTAVTGKPDSVAPLVRAREQCADAADHEFERCVVLQAATIGLQALAGAPLPNSVKLRIADEMQGLVSAPASALAHCGLGTAAFERLCRIATLRRFPAGVFEWEVSGIPRSYCIETAIADWPRVAAFVAWHMKGFGPVFFSHLGARSLGRPLEEGEANRSYYRMAMALQRQPEVLGFGACSWFRAPSTHRVSPRLAWVSKVFQENGGLVVDAGLDGPNSGALYRSATRRALYEAGTWQPRRGLVMWPRDAMLAWAARHPELADDEDEL